MFEPDRLPSKPDRDHFAAARDVQRLARTERERRVVEELNDGLAMAEIARREGISARGLRKYVRNLIARRAPEATGEFIAVPMNRLNEALFVGFGAMSGGNLPAVDRVVKIVRELDRYHGLGGGAQGTETRRKLLKSLDSGAGLAPDAPPFGEGGSGEAWAEDDAAGLDAGARGVARRLASAPRPGPARPEPKRAVSF